MILIESNDKILKSLTINAELMFRDVPIETVEIQILRSGIHVFPEKLINQSFLPAPIKQNFLNLTNWLVSRGLIMHSHRNIFFTEIPLNLENRNPQMPLILSLSTNSTSLSDKYWLNPKETTKFICNGARILFERKTWGEIDPFKNIYVPGELEKYGLCDTFFIEKPENINPCSLIWSTRGCQNKRWMFDDNGYYLEKKLYKSPFENELATLDFFLLNDVIVPKYNYYIKELNRKDDETSRLFRIDTIDEGLHVIQKRCLTDSNSRLESLSEYVQNNSEISDPIRKMFDLHNVDKKETDRFIQLIKKYQAKFDVEGPLLDTRNMGLLINKDGARPVVWGRLKMKRNWVGKIDE